MMTSAAVAISMAKAAISKPRGSAAATHSIATTATETTTTQSVEFLDDGGLQIADCFFGRPMCTSDRLLHHSIDHAKRLQIACRHPHRFGGIGRLVGGTPQDGSAALG